MKNFDLFCAILFSFLTIQVAAKPAKSGCLEKEKALTLLETAENLLSKAEDTYPACQEETNSTDQLECGGKKPLAYIEIAKKLISDVRVHFPTCSTAIAQYDKPSDCSGILASGRNKSGLYMIWPREPYSTGKQLQVYCDMETDDGGWTVIQRRGKYPVQLDFYQDWESYKNGFGNISQEFWLGNENIRVLCHRGCDIRFDLQDEDGYKAFAVYKEFYLTGNNYTIQISDYYGDAGDSMQFQNNFDFSTKDRGCTSAANSYEGGWWYEKSTIFCNLNGVYLPGQDDSKSVHWYKWRNFNNLARVEIKVRPN